MPQTTPAARDRAQVVDRRSRELEDQLARDRAEHRPDDKRQAAGPHDQPLPNRTSRIVRPR